MEKMVPVATLPGASRQVARKWRAADLVGLLAARHAEDVFVPECKDGPSHGSDMLRLDVWAMKKSWSNPCVTGYEIKVSRSDFQRDEKWRGYLACCNEFYFVCPHGLLKPEEIPEPAGLLVASATGSILYKKKKAGWRDAQIPDTVYRYILMCRAKITRDNGPVKNREYWERWLRDQKIDREFGWNVRGRIKDAFEKRVAEVTEENKTLKRKHDEYENVRRTLKELGIDPDERYLSSYSVRNRIDEIRQVVPRGLETSLNEVVRSLGRFQAELKKLEAPDFSPGAAEGEALPEAAPAGGSNP
jgi:hypothetical protein